MKAQILTILAAALVFASGAAVRAQTLNPAPVTAASGAEAKTNDQFRALLCAQPWSWERTGEKRHVVNFDADGKVTDNKWVAHYTIVDAHKVTLNLKNKHAHLTFSDDYSSFTGVDFNEATPLSGKPVK